MKATYEGIEIEGSVQELVLFISSMKNLQCRQRRKEWFAVREHLQDRAVYGMTAERISRMARYVAPEASISKLEASV